MIAASGERTRVNELVDWLTIALLPGLGPRAGRVLASRGPLRDSLRHPRDHADLLSEAATARLESGEPGRVAADEIRRAEGRGAALVHLDSPDYPAPLLQIYDPPLVLWVLGRLRGNEAGPTVALVGTRAASSQGRTLARGMARDLAVAGASIVSGLARGIDTAAHEGALDGGGRTLAVLGSGVDRVYPPENEDLAGRIATDGAVVSEFPLGTPPLAGHFPRRNRIIAGLSEAVVVVEAPKRSGALVTARLALDEGRDVFAVPGHPAAPSSVGTNALIRDGAVLVRDARDVAEGMGLVLEAVSETEPADVVLRLLHRDVPLSLDEIRERSGRSTAELVSQLSILELDDRVRRLPGALYVKS
jgi:DNA processing protein